MIKPIDGLYECKRSYNWLKAKPFIEVSLHVIDIEEGTGKYEGNTGALQCQGTDDGNGIRQHMTPGHFVYPRQVGKARSPEMHPERFVRPV